MRNIFTSEEEELIHHFPFAQLICHYQEQLHCTSTPVLWQVNHGHFLAHLSKNNPLVQALEYKQECCLIFQAQEQYISPIWHQQQIVPTWNYAQLQLDCSVQLINDLVGKQRMLQLLSDQYEQSWSLANSHISGKQLQQMLKAIEVYIIQPVKLTSRFKLSQNKSTECRRYFAKKMQQQGKDLLAKWQLSPPKEHRSLLCKPK